MDWYPKYFDQYAEDTRHLSCLEHGAYNLLIDDYYRTRRPLPDHDQALANITRLPLDEWRKIAPTIRAFFTARGGLLHHRRINQELDDQDKRAKTRTEKSEKAASIRWGTKPEDRLSRSERLAKARQLGTHTAAEWEAMLSILGNCCVKCGLPGDQMHGGSPLKDHILPIYKGGSDAISNIQPMCRNCNSRKGDEVIDYREKAVSNWLELFNNACQTPAKRLPADATETKTDTRTEDNKHLALTAREVIEAFDRMQVQVFNGQRRAFPAGDDIVFAQRWVEAGADLPTLEGLFLAKLQAKKSRGEPTIGSLKFFDQSVASIISGKKQLAPIARASPRPKREQGGNTMREMREEAEKKFGGS